MFVAVDFDFLKLYCNHLRLVCPSVRHLSLLARVGASIRVAHTISVNYAGRQPDSAASSGTVTVI